MNLTSTTNNGRPLRVDKHTDALAQIAEAHFEVHEGEAFFIVNKQDVDSAGSYEMRFKTPDSPKRLHMILAVEGTGHTDVDLYEGTTKTHNTGTVLTAVNRERESKKTSLIEACSTPGGSGDGENLISMHFGLDTGQGSQREILGGGARDMEEIILARNTAYLLRIVSGTDGNRVMIVLDWYEHESQTTAEA
jgi:hypothetical protein